MKRYRTRPKIIGDLLRAEDTMDAERKGLGITVFLRE